MMAGGVSGREDQEEEELSVRDVSCGSQLLAGRRRPQDPLRQVSDLYFFEPTDV